MSLTIADAGSRTTLALVHGPGACAEARHRLDDALSAAGYPHETLLDATIVMGELVDNAVEHGRPGPDGTIEVWWELHEGWLQISVTDGGHVAVLVPRCPDADSARGRGLAMIDRIAEGWTVDDDHGTRVTARLRVG